MPLSFYSVICFYFVLTLFPTVNPCNISGRPLGFESGALPDSAFSESSCYSASLCSRFGRLNYEAAWAASLSDQNQWMQVQFESSYIVTAITTQGSKHIDQWVTSYTFSSSFDNMAWTDYLNVYSGSVEVIPKLRFLNYIQQKLSVVFVNRDIQCDLV